MSVDTVWASAESGDGTCVGVMVGAGWEQASSRSAALHLHEVVVYEQLQYMYSSLTECRRRSAPDRTT